jgi:hypothetical protein
MKRLAILALVVACGPAREPRTVSLRVKGGPPNASVTIDDIFVGTLDVVAARGVALPVGTHRLSVEAPGYLPLDRFVEAKEAPVSLDVTLVPIPD